MASSRVGKSKNAFSCSCLLVIHVFNIKLVDSFQHKNLRRIDEYPLEASDVTQYRSLAPSILRELWEYRRDVLFLNALIDLLFFVSFSYLYSGLSAYARMFVWVSPNLRLSMINCIALGSLFPAVEFLQNLGTLGAGIYISGWPVFQTNAEYYSALEISYLVELGRSAFVFALSYLFLAAALIISYILNRKERVVSEYHGFLGLAVAAACIIVFGLGAALGGTDTPIGRSNLAEAFLAVNY